MKTTQNNWTRLWQDTRGFDGVMSVVMPDFAERLIRKFNFSKDDFVLDYGCGLGYLENHLHDKVKGMHGIDISERYITDCNKRFDNTNCTFFKLDPDDFLNYSILNKHTYSKVILMSVIQYFGSTNEIRKMIENIRPLIKPGGIMIIADIVVEESKIKDLCDLFFFMIKKGKLFLFIRYALFIRFSQYYQIRKSTGLLITPVEKIMQIVADLNLKSELVNDLTYHSARKNIVIYF